MMRDVRIGTYNLEVWVGCVLDSYIWSKERERRLGGLV